jgi:hypothetical protein
MVSRLSLVLFCVLATQVSLQSLHADESKTPPNKPLHEVIDGHLIPFAGAKPNLCSDSEFVRRVSLDLIGVPPTAAEAREFLSSTAPNKRALYIDRLLQSPHYARHLAESIDLMLMERRANKHVSAVEWQDYLYQAAKSNKPWNILAREILAADGDKSAPRAAVRFYLDRSAEAHVLARDVGRIFFGRDMQCAQCHDHPLIDDYHQRDYHGLLAFMLPGYQVARKEGKVTKTYYAEKSGNDVSFTSVFIEGINHTTRARLIGAEPLVEPAFLPGTEYKVAPAANVISIPKFSRRAILAADTTSGRNQAFNRNIANRLWAQMVGRGLVHPVDLHHSANPPSHPQLLQDLSDRFVASGFDVKAFLREIALSSSYQRSIDLPANLTLASKNASQSLPLLKAEREALKKKADELQVTFDSAGEVRDKAEAAFLPVLGEMAKARKAYADIVAKVTAAKAKLKPAATKRAAKEKQFTAFQAAASATEIASKAIPSDKEIASAFAVLKKKADAAQAALVALRKTEASLEQAVAAQVKALEKPQQVIESVELKLKPLRETVLATEKTAVVARRSMIQSATMLAKKDKQIEHAEQFVAYATLNSQLAAARTIVKESTPKLAALQKQLTLSTLEAKKAAAQQQQATAAKVASVSQMTAATNSRDQKDKAFKVIASVAASSKVAAAKLSFDKTLAETATALDKRLNQAKQELASASSQVVVAETVAKQAAREFDLKQKSHSTAETKRAALNKQVATLTQSLAAANSTIATAAPKLSESVDGIVNGWSNNFTIADLKPLTPEQMYWSIVTVGGVYRRVETGEEAAINKAKPLTDAIKADAKLMQARSFDLERATWKKLKSSITTFSKIYGAGAGQPQGDFFATADQALFAGNGGSIVTWIGADGKNVAHRMNVETDTKKIAEDLYLSVLTRFPTAAETADVASHLADRKDKPVAIQELIWGLVTSVEFRFNH